MELREKAGSGDMLSVEKRLERQKAKAEHRLRQLAANAERDNTVFDFINSKLARKAHGDAKCSFFTISKRRRLYSSQVFPL